MVKPRIKYKNVTLLLPRVIIYLQERMYICLIILRSGKVSEIESVFSVGTLYLFNTLEFFF